MDDENLHQEGYFTAFGDVISALDPKAADFDFQLTNLRNAVQISGLLNVAEKQRLMTMLHILQTRGGQGGAPQK